MHEHRAALKEKVIGEAKKLAMIVAYLWALFLTFEFHKISILRQQNPETSLNFKIGFALINALVLGEVILLGQAFHLGERYNTRPLVYAVLFKSAVFAILLLVFDVLEEVIVGLFHHKTIAQGIPPLGGGGLEGMLLVVGMAFIVLIPFFSFAELASEFGQGDMFSMIFRARSRHP